MTSVAGAIEQQSAATREISANMQATTMAVNDVDYSLGQIAKAIESASEQAEEGMYIYRSVNAVVAG